MPNHDEVYRKEAENYERLILREDYEGNLLKALRDVRPFEGVDLVDTGAGTGRLSCLLAPYVRSVTALDTSEAMLKVAAGKLRRSGYAHWRTETGDHRDLPLPDASADVVVSGWSVCYVASANHADWRENLERTITEMKRILRPGGTIILIETLGTGEESPRPPGFLQPYYRELEATYGFRTTWIRTDYRFADAEEAVQLTAFFFGDELAERVRKEKLSILPECTGIWWLNL